MGENMNRADHNYDDTIDLSKTVIVFDGELMAEDSGACPAIVLQYQGYLNYTRLTGTQTFGRPTKSETPDISINVPFVSRKHGLFLFDGQTVRYTSLSATNGTFHNGRKLQKAESVVLADGDVLKIYSGTAIQDYSDVRIECVFSEERKKAWRAIIGVQYDTLTCLMNRKTFSNWFESKRSLSKKVEMCFFISDIDHLKRINDTYGHESGDRALAALADMMKKALGENGQLCRWGGDQFAGVIMANRYTALRLMEQIRSTVEKTQINRLFPMSISVGMVDIIRFERSVSLEQIAAWANQGLHLSKQRGRNTISFSN